MRCFVVVLHLLVNHPVGLLQERSQVDAAQIDVDGQMPLVHLAGDGAGTGRHLDVRYLAQRYLGARTGGQHQVADILRSIACLLAEAADNVVGLAAYKYLRNGFPADGKLYQVGYIRDIQSVLGNAVAVGHNL